MTAEKSMKFLLMGVSLLLAACGTATSTSSAADNVEDAGMDGDKPALQAATVGTIDRHYVYSPQMGETITVDVWTPEGYDKGARRYPVIYMHDGQNLFDAATSWNRQSWEMDSVTGELVRKGEIAAPVIVGVHSVAATRTGDLMPEKALGYIKEIKEGAVKEFLDTASVRGDAYAAFIVKTLKPMIDTAYRVGAAPDSTFVMGSSMGGLMSVYALSEYPEVFGGAGCLSTHWVGTLDGDPTFSDAMYAYLSERLPRDGRHRLYFDHGTTSIDSLYGPSEDRVIALAKGLGYADSLSGAGVVTLEWFVDEGAGHEERYWAARVARPLRFLLGRR